MIHKAICPICKKDGETIHTFDVDSDQEYCYCPECGKKLLSKVAIDNFCLTIRQMVRKANYQVHIAGKFEKAYRNFGEILSLQPDNPFALTGRALSLMLMSTLRHQRFDDALTLIHLARQELRKQRNQITYFEFLARTGTIIKIYIDAIYEKLTFKDYFYDKDCASLFLERVSLSIKILRLVCLEIENLINKGLTNSRVSEKLSKFSEILQALNSFEKKDIFTIDGKAYLCQLNEEKHLELIENKEKDSTPVEPNIMRGLVEKDHKTKLIKDRIFKARKGKFILATCLMGGSFFFLVLGILLIILGALVPCNTMAMYACGGVSLGFSIIGFIWRIAIKKKLKRSKLLNITVEF